MDIILILLAVHFIAIKLLAFLSLPLAFHLVGEKRMNAMSEQSLVRLLAGCYLADALLTALLMGLLALRLGLEPGQAVLAASLLFLAGCGGTWLNWSRKKEQLLAKWQKAREEQ